MSKLMEMREKAFGLLDEPYRKYQIWAADLENTTWRVHPDTYAEMWRDPNTLTDGLIPDPATGGVNWLGIPLIRDRDVPLGQLELRWAVRSA